MTGKETKNIMVRAGSAPKTICFSHTQTKRQFEFQDLNFSKISNEVSAKMAKKVSTKPINLLTESNLEHEDFRKVKVYKLPDTSRCFIPELNNEPDKISKRLLEARLHRTHYESPGNFNTLLCKTGNEFSITNCRKQSNSKIYRSYVLGTEVSENDCSRRFYKKCEFGKYNSTTQILTIPGGVKRTSPILEKTKISSSFNIKIMNDYKSKISCLPGTVKKVEKSEPLSKRLFTTKSRNDQIETTIFYTQTDNSQVKTTETFKNLKTEPSNMTHFNVSNNNRSKKDRDIFGQSNKEKKFISQTKLKRPLYIKNPFESQITII